MQAFSFSIIFLLSGEIFLNISCSTGLMAMDSFSFCISENVFSFLEDIFIKYRITDGQYFFSLQYFKDIAPLSSGLHCFQDQHKREEHWEVFISPPTISINSLQPLIWKVYFCFFYKYSFMTLLPICPKGTQDCHLSLYPVWNCPDRFQNSSQYTSMWKYQLDIL